jgi:hypothetical protein
MLNPNFPLYVREGDAIDPYLIAYYDWGETSTHDLTNKSPEEIDGIIKNVSSFLDPLTVGLGFTDLPAGCRLLYPR